MTTHYLNLQDEPFNAIKDAAVIFGTIISYKTLHQFIDKLQN